MYDVHHITHQELLLCLPDKFYSYLFIILKMGGWGVWGGMESGRDGGYCLPLFTVILHVFYVEKSLTQGMLYIHFRRTLMRKKKSRLTQLVDATLHW